MSNSRWLVFFYCVLVLSVLLALALLYAAGELEPVIAASIPQPALVAAWAGALGGVAISFKGVFDHNTEPVDAGGAKATAWDEQMVPWHLGRPFTGTIVGIFVYLALKAAYPSGAPSSATLGAASFVLGTQEKAFFDFVKQIGAVVVSVPNKARGAKETNGHGG